MDFSVAKDGASGEWYGNEFLLTDHGWTGLIADLLGAWNPTDNTSAGVVPDDEPRQLGPFAMLSRSFGVYRRLACQRSSIAEHQTGEEPNDDTSDSSPGRSHSRPDT